MAAEIEKHDNMFSVKETPWHKLGVVIEKAPTIEEGIKLAGLDWRVNLHPLTLQGTNQLVTHKAVIREDVGNVLGIVGPNWTPLQNKDSFAFFDDFLQNGSASLETAGSLRNGEKVWILAKICADQYEVVKGDPIERYILLSNSHNIGAVRVGFTNVRVVCNNTLTMAHNSDASKLIRIKHTTNVKQNLANIKDVMKVADQEFIATVQQFERLTRKDIVQKDIEKFVQLTFFEGKDVTSSTRTENRYKGILNRIEDLIETGRGSDLKGVKGTVWGLYNASTEYLTHEAKNDEETRLESLWFGDNVKLSQKILTTALEFVEA